MIIIDAYMYRFPYYSRGSKGSIFCKPWISQLLQWKKRKRNCGLAWNPKSVDFFHMCVKRKTETNLRTKTKIAHQQHKVKFAVLMVYQVITVKKPVIVVGKVPSRVKIASGLD